MSDRELPKLWENPVPRFDYYALELRQFYESTGNLQPNCWPMLLAIGAAESGLDNWAMGDNEKNGTPVGSPAYPYHGWGWMQIDGYWLRRNIEARHWPVDQDYGQFRLDPQLTLVYISNIPGFVTDDNGYYTQINYNNWAVFKAGKHKAYLPNAEAAVLKLRKKKS
jgi:hypothetical protein